MAESKFKAMMNSLSSNASVLCELTPEENQSLKSTLVQMFIDVQSVCQKYSLIIMLGGGSALGCVRHHGFIPWDDDLDLMMPRSDYQVFKSVFEKELGDRYILSAPNYKGRSKARFPKIIKKNTVLKELTDINSNLPCGIFLDIFLIENVPDNKLIQRIKGIWCSFLMFASTQAFWYEHRCDELQAYMCQTNEGRKTYKNRMRIGRFCSIIPSWKWFNAVDNSVQYHGKSKLVGMPTGRKHYFGEIHPREVLLPVSYGTFCGINAPLPGNANIYLKTLYGESYMELPPESKREKHFIVDFELNVSGGIV